MLTLFKRFLTQEVKNKIKANIPRIFSVKNSYSQCGEDLIVAFLLDSIYGPGTRTYLDLGANHPFKLSNTALFYHQGGRGVLVEPDPYLAKVLGRTRPRDLVIQKGVHVQGLDSADFFIMEPPTLNTFSKAEMERYAKMGHPLRQTVTVALENVNTILSTNASFDFMTIDIEGLDAEVLRSVDWHVHRPTCVCVETLTYEKNNAARKITEINDYMISQGYLLYADTYINSIYVDLTKWNSRRCSFVD
jgi:FkbM family methyltransferase